MGQKKVLLVDDEPNIRLVLSAILEQSGYEVDTAEDGFVALRKMQQSVPDLLVTDLRMPNMNGFELLSVVRTRYPHLPAIAISGEFFSQEVCEGLIADAFFQKGSYSVSEFLQTITKLLTGPVDRSRPAPPSSPIWSPVGDAPVMLTCTECLRTFPIDLCDGTGTHRETDCVFCGAHLKIEIAAIGTSTA